MQKATLNGWETIQDDKIVGTDVIDSVKCFKNEVSSKGNCISFSALLNVPADCKIVKAGLIATSNSTKAKNLTAENADYVKYMETTKHTAKYTWTKTKVGNETWYVRPYLVYTDSLGTERIVYGDLTTQKYKA